MTPTTRSARPSPTRLIPALLALCAWMLGAQLTPGATGSAHAAATLSLTQHVDPFIGTAASAAPDPIPNGAGGNTYPGAVYPFGMVQFSPDTTQQAANYLKTDTAIRQFSLTHFNGAGCSTNQNIEIMPTTVSSLSTSPGANWAAYSSTKSSESASPGYYATTLGDSTRVELSATQRTGAARITFPAGTTARLLVNTSGNATNASSFAHTTVSGTEISGWTTGGDFCTQLRAQPNAFRIFFVMQFDRTATGYGTWNGRTVSTKGSSADGNNTGGYVTFDTSTDRTVNVKVGVSFVSLDGARANLSQEQASGSTFDTVKTSASTAWNSRLNAVQVTGGADADLKTFYTALYHVMQNPNIASDVPYTDSRGTSVPARYLGFDSRVHAVPTGMGAVYQNFSGWDIYRSWAALVSIVAPDVMKDVVRSMLLDGNDGGLLPSWSQQSTETYTMPGDPGPIVVSSAYAFGVRTFDTTAALNLMKANAAGNSFDTPTTPSDPNGAYSWFQSARVRDEYYNYGRNGYIPR